MIQSQIRNFAIIAHVDAGKSTLSDRLMETTGVVSKESIQEQILDSNPIERERGVTIKLAPVTMVYRPSTTANSKWQIAHSPQQTGQKGLKAGSYKPLAISDSTYTLNLIDTPGHADFSYEVERSLAACEGAVLLVDATRGIQAQTLSHAHRALDLGLVIVPVVNKIDLPAANPNQCIAELSDAFGFLPREIQLLCATTGEGVIDLIGKIITEVPAPAGKSDQPLRALIFNSAYDQHLGVIAYIRVVDGILETGRPIRLLGTNQKISSKEIGVFIPQKSPT